ncbi:MAG: hypothetical protein O2884_02955 [Chloroflexi bacterium]|nr:hypothetical protein [Chloroflexota bacterium]
MSILGHLYAELRVVLIVIALLVAFVLTWVALEAGFGYLTSASYYWWALLSFPGAAFLVYGVHEIRACRATWVWPEVVAEVSSVRMSAYEQATGINADTATEWEVTCGIRYEIDGNTYLQTWERMGLQKEQAANVERSLSGQYFTLLFKPTDASEAAILLRNPAGRVWLLAIGVGFLAAAAVLPFSDPLPGVIIAVMLGSLFVGGMGVAMLNVFFPYQGQHHVLERFNGGPVSRSP